MRINCRVCVNMCRWHVNVVIFWVFVEWSSVGCFEGVPVFQVGDGSFGGGV